MNTRQHIFFWFAVFAVFLVVLWQLNTVLLPFVAGMAVAYFLNPLCLMLGQRGVSRTAAALIVLGLFVAIVLAVFLLIAPTVASQLTRFASQIPGYLDELRNAFQPRLHDVLSNLSDQDYQRLREAAAKYAGDAAGALTSVVEGVWRGGSAMVQALSLLLIMPVVAFYLLRDWTEMVGKIDSWLPRRHAVVIRQQFGEIDRTLAGFMRGQSLVCLILGTYYAVALSFIGLDFAIVIGLSAGVLSFMPFIGSTFGLIAALLIAFIQFDGYTQMAMVAAAFLFAQFMEGNFITPKLVGESVGLHPVWIIFALMAGGSLFGFVGLLVAVPVAAVIGVLLRFVLGRYLESGYYTGGVKRARRVGPL